MCSGEERHKSDFVLHVWIISLMSFLALPSQGGISLCGHCRSLLNRYTLTPLAAIQHNSELPEGRRKAALPPVNTDPTLFSAIEHQIVSDIRTPGWGQKLGLAEVASWGGGRVWAGKVADFTGQLSFSLLGWSHTYSRMASNSVCG